MNLLQIEYFLLLAKIRSFRKTAEALYVSQPAVSKQIAQLEKEWGVQLFVRKYKEAILTPAGEILYESISRCRADFRNALDQAQHSGSSVKTLLHVGIPEHSDFENLFDIVSRFQEEHHDVVLNVESAPIAQLVVELLNSKYDMIVSHEYNLTNRVHLDSCILASRRHTVVISEKHPLVVAKPDLQIADLANERIYVPAPEGTSLSVDYCKFICAQHGFTPREVVHLPNVDSVLLATKMCFGVAVLDDLVTIPVKYHLKILPTDVGFHLRLAWHRENSKPIISELAKVIREQLVIHQT